MNGTRTSVQLTLGAATLVLIAFTGGTLVLHRVLYGPAGGVTAPASSRAARRPVESPRTELQRLSPDGRGNRCSAARALRRVERVLSPVARARSIGLTVRNSSPGVAVTAECNRLVSVLLRLSEQAIEASPAGGKLALSLARSGDEVIFSVSPNGTQGTPQPLGFDPFWKREAADALRDPCLGTTDGAPLHAAQFP